MQIKATDKKGNAIAFQPHELVDKAILYGIKTQNSLERVYWIKPGVTMDGAIQSHVNPVDNTWTAQAKGSVLIGYTDAKTDQFFEPKRYAFEVHYSSSKDNLGLPDLKIDLFTMDLLDANPSKLMGFPEKVEVVVAPKVEKTVEKKSEKKADKK